jgi:DNA repair protein RadA/Sms
MTAEASVSETRPGAAPAVGTVARFPSRPLSDIQGDEVARAPTGLGELDRCLGGGLVPGSLILLGGEPGIGKSTLMLQACEAIARSGRRTLYVSGEESPAQVRLRADRIGAGSPDLLVLGETDLDAILAEVARLKPAVLVVDSVQVVHDQALGSAPGTVSQVKHAADRLLRLAKETSVATFLVGHVTKDGALAGPRTLEHLVDTVLSFESESSSSHRLVRTVKNRFGPSGEVGVFEMKGDGLAEVPDASRYFLAERRTGTPGSVVYPSMEGTRPVLVEIQALVGATPYSQPRRQTLGVDPSRLSMLLAVSDRCSGQPASDRDVFVNVAGGLRVKETAADLPVLVAIASALMDRPLSPDVAVFGEIGLGGEVRSVDRVPSRLREVRAMGFTRCIVPRRNVAPGDAPRGLQVVPVDDVSGAIDAVFSRLVPVN